MPRRRARSILRGDPAIAHSIGSLRLLRNLAVGHPGYRHVSLLADASVERALERDGFCVTDHVLAPERVRRLLEIVDAHEPMAALDRPGRVHALRWGDGEDDLPMAMFAELYDLLVPALEPLVDLASARIVPSAFQVKPSSSASHLRAHQDAPMTDEARAFGLNAWACLGESTEASGALFVLPRSHAIGNRIRVGTTTDDLSSLHEVVRRHARVLPVATGQVVLLDHAVVHGSLPNASGRRRVAASCHIVPRSHDLVMPSAVPGSPGRAEVRRLRVEDLDAAARDVGAGRAPSVEEVADGEVEVDELAFRPWALALASWLHARRNPPAGDAPMLR